MTQSKERVLVVLGWLFLVVGILSVINTIFFLENYGQLVWFCNVSLFVFGYAVLKRNSYLLMGQICVLFIPVLYWNVDFFYVLFTGDSLWGITDYFFEWGTVGDFGRAVTMYHLFSVPLALVALFLMKRDSRSEWVFSGVEVVVLFVLAKVLTAAKHNINCVYRACVPISLGLPHEVTWFILYIFMIGATYIFLNSFSFLKRGGKA